MRKKVWGLVLALALVCTGARADTRLAVSADLHFCVGESRLESGLAQMRYISEITDALLKSARETDALIILGDMTNNGREEEHRALADRLEQSGVRVLVLPGNHDLGSISDDRFRELYENAGYKDALSRDENSLSYAARIGEVTLFLLDVNSRSGVGGVISQKTLSWLAGEMEAASERGDRMITLSHYSVLNDCMPMHRALYGIENGETLLALLKKYRVPLHLSGHRHIRQVFSSSGDEYPRKELVVDMPAEYPNAWALVTLSSEGIRYRPQTLTVDADVDFSAFSQACARKRARGSAQSVLSGAAVTESEREQLTDYFETADLAYRSGTLFDIAGEMKDNSLYTRWQQSAGKSVYGPWLAFVLEKANPDTQGFFLPWD